VTWLLAGALAAATLASRPAPVVQLAEGRIRGSWTSGGEGGGGGGGAQYLGVPFAAPPIGAAGRWQPPSAAAPWAPGVRNATAYSPPCAQTHDWSGRSGSAEDCLYLDIYTPPSVMTAAAAAPHAVLLFFHGGGFMSGDSEGPSLAGVPGSQLFNGTYVAHSQDVVVV
jgi:para-nitrobenzyl esterase